MTPEGKILAHARTTARKLGLRYMRISMIPGVETGWMDVIILGPEGCAGQILWMETKSAGKPLRPIQAHRRDIILKRGGRWCKPDTVEDVDRELKKFLKMCQAEQRRIFYLKNPSYLETIKTQGGPTVA